MYLGQHQQRTKSYLARSRRVNVPLLPAFRLGSVMDLSCARRVCGGRGAGLNQGGSRNRTGAEARCSRWWKFQPIALDPKTAEALRKKTEEPVRESF